MPPFTSPIPESAPGTALTLEMAHVLFMDVVAYSALPMDQQQRLLCELQEAVRSTPACAHVEAEDKLIRLPTGDGMALVFFGDPESPVRCALELSRSLRQHPDIKLRMGIHTGPVYRVADINAARNVAGGGINMAQRVMDYGDAGHILVSSSVADTLAQVGTWSQVVLQDLGEAELKHGVRLHIYNLYTEEAGNPALPQKLEAARQTATAVRSRAKRKHMAFGMAVALVVVAIAAGAFLYRRQGSPKLSAQDTVVIADFDNKTGDPVFDDTLKTALTVALTQSPFLNVLSNERVAQMLKLMMRPPDTTLTPDVARDLCQRANSKAYIAGSIVRLGSEYVVGLNAVNCHSGRSLAEEQVTAESKEKVLNAVGNAASKLRGRLGESLATVQKFDAPLQDVTTSSLEALKAFSLAVKARERSGSETEAVPLFKRAIELDPQFTMGYNVLAIAYTNLGERSQAMEYAKKAYELREHLSERERFAVSWNYYCNGLGDVLKATEVAEQWVETYPSSAHAYERLGAVLSIAGQWEKSLAASQKAVQLAPYDPGDIATLALNYMALNRFDQAGTALEQASARKLDGEEFRLALYSMAFLLGDSAGMQRQLTWAAQDTQEEHSFLAVQAATEAYYGRLTQARDASQRGVQAALQAGSKENAGHWRASQALWNAEIGNNAEARDRAAEALRIAPATYWPRIMAAVALSRAGQTAAAQKLADDLANDYPSDNIVQSYYLPVIRASNALNNHHAQEAIELLQPATEYELGRIGPLPAAPIYPAYVRGLAFLMAGKGPAAAAEFQKLLDHRGIVQYLPVGALAHLQIGRAYMLSGDTPKAKQAYGEFLNLWKQADPSIPIYKQAKAEYAKLP